MNTKHITAGALAGLLLTAGVVGTVSAQTAAEATGLTADQAIKIALMEVPGEVQEAELETEDGMRIFEVEILTADGVEMELEIDATTGEILEVEAEDDDDDDDDDSDDA